MTGQSLTSQFFLRATQATHNFMDEHIQALAGQGFDGLTIPISKRVPLVEATKIPATQAVCNAYLLDHLKEGERLVEDVWFGDPFQQSIQSV